MKNGVKREITEAKLGGDKNEQESDGWRWSLSLPVDHEKARR